MSIVALPGIGPDVAIVGTARSGTTALAAALGHHPGIDLPAMKEPGYFAQAWDNGPRWYDRLFSPRGDLLRLDASVVYTYADQPEAVPRLLEASPHARLIYVVREPISRAFSQWHHDTVYLGGDRSARFADIVSSPDGPLGASSYGPVLERLEELRGRDGVLVVPFEAVRDDLDAVARAILAWLGLDAGDLQPVSELDLHRNERVVMKHRIVGQAFNWARDTKLWPFVRHAIGDERMRRLKRAVTTHEGLTDLEDALAGLDDDLCRRLEQVYDAARAAVADRLAWQDQQLGLDWRGHTSWLDRRAFESDPV